jgi:hypothetical protein
MAGGIEKKCGSFLIPIRITLTARYGSPCGIGYPLRAIPFCEPFKNPVTPHLRSFWRIDARSIQLVLTFLVLPKRYLWIEKTAVRHYSLEKQLSGSALVFIIAEP